MFVAFSRKKFLDTSIFRETRHFYQIFLNFTHLIFVSSLKGKNIKILERTTFFYLSDVTVEKSWAPEEHHKENPLRP